MSPMRGQSLATLNPDLLRGWQTRQKRRPVRVILLAALALAMAVALAGCQPADGLMLVWVALLVLALAGERAGR